MNDLLGHLGNENLILHFFALSYASSFLYVCGDGELSFGNFIESLGFGLAILVASVLGLILFKSIGSLWAGVSMPRTIASSVVAPVGAF